MPLHCTMNFIEGFFMCSPCEVLLTYSLPVFVSSWPSLGHLTQRAYQSRLRKVSGLEIFRLVWLQSNTVLAKASDWLQRIMIKGGVCGIMTITTRDIGQQSWGRHCVTFQTNATGVRGLRVEYKERSCDKNITLSTTVKGVTQHRRH